MPLHAQRGTAGGDFESRTLQFVSLRSPAPSLRSAAPRWLNIEPSRRCRCHASWPDPPGDARHFTGQPTRKPWRSSENAAGMAISTLAAMRDILIHNPGRRRPKRWPSMPRLWNRAHPQLILLLHCRGRPTVVPMKIVRVMTIDPGLQADYSSTTEARTTPPMRPACGGLRSGTGSGIVIGAWLHCATSYLRPAVVSSPASLLDPALVGLANAAMLSTKERMPPKHRSGHARAGARRPSTRRTGLSYLLCATTGFRQTGNGTRQPEWSEDTGFATRLAPACTTTEYAVGAMDRNILAGTKRAPPGSSGLKSFGVSCAAP